MNRPADWGVGFMSQGSMLSVLANGISTSPTRRGHMVRSTLMCTTVPPPPPVVDPIPEPTEAKTTRQRYEELHAGNAACSGCHKLMDPIGFAFEHLDRRRALPPEGGDVRHRRQRRRSPAPARAT